MDLKLVSAQSSEQIDAARADERLSYYLQELAANILRVIAGAGKANLLGQQMAEATDRWDELMRFVGTSAYPFAPCATVHKALRDRDWRQNDPKYTKPSNEDEERWERDGSRAIDDAQDEILIHALRLVAAQLARQPTQEATADHDLFRAISDYERLRHIRNAKSNLRW